MGNADLSRHGAVRRYIGIRPARPTREASLADTENETELARQMKSPDVRMEVTYYLQA
jgi:hypothetical protein